MGDSGRREWGDVSDHIWKIKQKDKVMGNWASDERNKAGIKKIFLRVSSKPQFEAWLPKKKSYRVPSTI